MSAHRSSVKVYDLGVYAFVSCAISMVISILQLLHTAQYRLSNNDATFVLRVANLAVVLVLALSCILLPRRPHVYLNGEQVDSEYTVTFLSRMTWGWAWPVLKIASNKGDLDKTDIPQPSHHIRANWLVAEWNAQNFKGGLLMSLVKLYWTRIGLQWSVALFRCVVGIGPFWVMLRLIQILEATAPEDRSSASLWQLILALAIFTFSEQVRYAFPHEVVSYIDFPYIDLKGYSQTNTVN